MGGEVIMNFVFDGFKDVGTKFWISIFDGSVSEINRDVSSAKDNMFPIVDLSMSFTFINEIK